MNYRKVLNDALRLDAKLHAAGILAQQAPVACAIVSVETDVLLAHIRYLLNEKVIQPLQTHPAAAASSRIALATASAVELYQQSFQALARIVES